MLKRLFLGLLALAIATPAAAQYGGGYYAGPVTSAQVVAALGYTPVNKAGDTGIGTLQLLSASTLNWNGDTILQREAANTLALYNGTTAQTFKVFNSRVDASNYSNLQIDMPSGTSARIISNWSGTGANLPLTLGAGTSHWTIATTGTLSSAGGTGTIQASASGTLGWSTDLTLFRDAADNMAMRRGTNAQILDLYGTFTDASNYERLRITPSASGVTTIASLGAGTGSGRTIRFNVNGIVYDLSNTAAAGFQSGGSVITYHATAGMGYGAGACSTVTQATSKATSIGAKNNVCLQITTNAAALAADTTVAFGWTNSAIAATDAVFCNHESGGTLGAYHVAVTPAAGSATVSLRNITPGSLSEAPVLRCLVFKATNS